MKWAAALAARDPLRPHSRHWWNGLFFKNGNDVSFFFRIRNDNGYFYRRQHHSEAPGGSKFRSSAFIIFIAWMVLIFLSCRIRGLMVRYSSSGLSPFNSEFKMCLSSTRDPTASTVDAITKEERGNAVCALQDMRHRLQTVQNCGNSVHHRTVASYRTDGQGL